jgi:signal transduction histidine kinase/integral membrane sensor domain MASE1
VTVSALRRSSAWVVVYALAVLVGRLTALPETGLALFWPAAGVAVLWVLGSPAGARHLDVGLLFASTVALNATFGVALVPALVFGLANVVVGASARAVLTRSIEPEGGGAGSPRATLGSTRGVIALGGAAVLAGVASAPLGTLAGYLITERATALGALAWAVRNATGVFVVAGVVLAIEAARRSLRPGSSWSALLTDDGRPHAVTELALTTGLTAAALVLVFDYDPALPIAFVLIAIAAFVGFRFTPVVAAVLTTAAGTFSIVATALGRGSFGAIDDPVASALVVQAFVLTQSAIALTLSWAISERRSLTLKLEAAREEAAERAQLLDAVTDTLAHGVAVIDGDGRVLVKNAAARTLVPGPQEQVTEEDQPERYGVQRADGKPMDLATMPHTVALESGESVVAELVVRRPEADETFVSVRAEPLELVGRRPRQVAVISMQDVTAHKEQVQQLESFAAVVAHDLRSPLTALTGWVDVLDGHLQDQGTRDGVAEEALGRITRAGERMSDLIEDLLAYATASSAPLRTEQVDLDQLVETLAAEVPGAGGDPPVITSQGLGSLRADPVLLRQVFANLIGNAVKYVADGVVPVVRISAERSTEATVIRVVDNGVGIPEEMRARVFEGFTRVGATARTRPGTGLGLAICARAVERHRGTIAAGPAPDGRGTTITLTFPADIAAASGTTASSEPPEPRAS